MNWYEQEVEELIVKREALSYQPQTVFYGSSSIRLWENLYEDFTNYLPVNLGFGGSTLEACVYFFDRIVSPEQGAQKIIIYAGDNDLGDGKSPEDVLYYFRLLEQKVQAHFANVLCYFISIKPSVSRWNIDGNIKKANELIETEINNMANNFRFINLYPFMLTENGYPNTEYYEEDGLHLAPKGYELWKEIVMKQVFLHN